MRVHHPCVANHSSSIASSASTIGSSSSSSIDLGDERLDQQAARGLLVDAARHQVEQMVAVDLGDGRAVAALHVVGEDLELRLGRELAIVRQKQRVAGHLGVGLLRVLMHVDAALEDAARPAGHDVADDFASSWCAARRGRAPWSRRYACRRRAG